MPKKEPKEEPSKPSNRKIWITRSLPCKLTQEELILAGERMSEALQRKERIEKELAAFKKQKDAEIKQAEAEAAMCSQMISSKTEYRYVECEVIFDFGTGIKSITRMDNGDIVVEERMSDSERQEELRLAS